MENPLRPRCDACYDTADGTVKMQTAGFTRMRIFFATALLLVASCGLQQAPSRAAPPDGRMLLARAQEYHRQGRFLEALSLYRDICLNAHRWRPQAETAARAIETLRHGYLGDNDTGLATVRDLPLIVRVLLAQTVEPMPLHCAGGAVVADDRQAPLKDIQHGAELLIRADNNSICINAHRLHHKDVRIIPSAHSVVSIRGQRTGGIVHAHADNDTLVLVAALPLEQYLEGVLPREMSPAWPAQALMAQAVAARTYALYHMIKRRDSCYDVHPTTSSQVFGGTEAATPETHAAITATRGVVLTFRGSIILALYHANSGGRTERADAVWGFEKPYLASVCDDFSLLQPGYRWEQTMTAAHIHERLHTYGLPARGVTDIVPIERAPSGRITKIKVVQGADSFLLTGNSLRLILGAAAIKSTWFDVARQADHFVFAGSGYGHGAGMSQRGAAAMARQGSDFKQILQWYYPGTHLVNIHEPTLHDAQTSGHEGSGIGRHGEPARH